MVNDLQDKKLINAIGNSEQLITAFGKSGSNPVAGERQHQADVAVALIVKVLIGIIRAHMIMKR